MSFGITGLTYFVITCPIAYFAVSLVLRELIATLFHFLEEIQSSVAFRQPGIEVATNCQRRTEFTSYLGSCGCR
jgi:hypothetical protein